MVQAIWVQILYEAVYISLCVNALGKDMNSYVLPTRYGEIVGQNGFIITSLATNLGEEKSLNPNQLCYP